MTPVPQRADAVVVGGGITGLAAAWALTRAGRDVLVLDQAPVGHKAGGSHGTCRIFRFGYDDPAYVTLAARARLSWAELESACGERLLHPTPQLTFGPQMPQVQAALTAAGRACELITAARAAERYPGVTAAGAVLVELESAVIAADRALACLASLARAAGRASPVLAGVRVLALADDGRTVLVRTSEGDIEADVVVVCAGPWTPRLAATAGITVPGSATLEQVAYLEPADGAGLAAAAQMPIFVHYDAAEFPYGLPVPGSRLYKIGVHHSGPLIDPDDQDQSADPGLTSAIEKAARRFLPWFNSVPVAQERCVYDNTPDADFIVDRIGNIVIGSGTSGHGFKFGPLLGEWLAGLAVTGRSPGFPERFSAARF